MKRKEGDLCEKKEKTENKMKERRKVVEPNTLPFQPLNSSNQQIDIYSINKKLGRVTLKLNVDKLA